MPAEKMKAIVVHGYGDAESMKLEQIDKPQPGPDQILVKVAVAGVNPIDWKLRSGAYKSFMPIQFPWTPGVECSGTVEAVGQGVTSFSPGQKVFGIVAGAYAEFAIAKAGEIALIPKSLSFEEAATLGVGPLTALQAIENLNLKKGDKVLIHGGAGGVGYFATQMAKHLGADVVVTASAANTELVRSLGASQVIDYTKTPFEKQVDKLDAVLDTVGGETLEKSYAVLKKGGRLTSVAGHIDEKRAAELGIAAKSSSRAPGSALKQIVELVQSGALKALVGAGFNLAAAAEAHRASESRHGKGRIVLKISN